MGHGGRAATQQHHNNTTAPLHHTNGGMGKGREHFIKQQHQPPRSGRRCLPSSSRTTYVPGMRGAVASSNFTSTMCGSLSGLWSTGWGTYTLHPEVLAWPGRSPSRHNVTRSYAERAGDVTTCATMASFQKLVPALALSSNGKAPPSEAPSSCSATQGPRTTKGGLCPSTRRERSAPLTYKITNLRPAHIDTPSPKKVSTPLVGSAHHTHTPRKRQP